jgi:PIN domain nuclease of toxin-antitoxin system
MKLLIDTHILIWMIEKPSELSPQTKELIEDYSNTLYVSVESLREIVIKQRTGEIDTPNRD